jgi:hypothetical protein
MLGEGGTAIPSTSPEFKAPLSSGFESEKKWRCAEVQHICLAGLRRCRTVCLQWAHKV